MPVASRAETPSAAMTTGARYVATSPSTLACTPTTRPERSSRTGPVTVVRSCSLAPAERAWSARVWSRDIRDFASPYDG